MALAAVYRALNLQNLMRALRGTVAISGMILFIILGATTFSQILSFSGATQGIVSAILGQGLSPLAILAGMMLLLIFLGIFVDQVSMMLITLPVFMPIVQRLDIDLIWFGVLYLICMQLGLLLPPHGLLLMTMKGVAPPQVTMAHIFRAVVPYIAMSLVLLLIIMHFRRSRPGCQIFWGDRAVLLLMVRFAVYASICCALLLVWAEREGGHAAMGIVAVEILPHGRLPWPGSLQL